MITTAEIVKFWGRPNLVRSTQAALESVSLPSQAKAFLSDVGLPAPPSDRLWEYQFDLQTLGRIPNKSSYVCISRHPRPICLDEARDGRVIMPAIDHDTERFMNSSVEKLCGFLTLVYPCKKALMTSEDDVSQSRALVTDLKEKLLELDPPAVRTEEAYWAVVLEDMWYPLMTDQELGLG